MTLRSSSVQLTPIKTRAVTATGQDKPPNRGVGSTICASFVTEMAIVTLSDALIGKGAGKAGSVLRDRRLCGLCLRIGARTQTFVVATTSRGKQIRVTLGRWPLLTVDEARELALPILRRCRAGEYIVAPVRAQLPTLRQVLPEYGKAKKVKASSLARYESVLKTHFADWFDRPVSALKEPAFGAHCYAFAQTKGAAIVDLGRGLVGSIIKFLFAVHSVSIENPFLRLSAAGLMPDRPQPRSRNLGERDLPAWWKAVDSLPERQGDYLRLIVFTGLRKNEGRAVRRRDVDLDNKVLSIPETKGKRPHSLPITESMRHILVRRCHGLEPQQLLFDGLSADHVTEMATRAGAPEFTLHDLRKLLASIGARLEIGDAILRRILGHAPKRGDVLHRHYVSLEAADIGESLQRIQSTVVQSSAKPIL
ncbi:Phage integrase family protein [Caballeronia terrestris]|uniref:Phage integrase family protein n=2 Tax=Caballeronia terrestris TaxID=1226301 RepID=A0A158K799_9BURK|nr:Phage integrase family protein [Caballeronia terrestris]